MEILNLILAVIIDLLVSAGFLWVGMKFASMYAGIPNGHTYCSYSALIKVCFFSSLVTLVPYVGWLASWVVLFYLLKYETEADPAELIIMVLVSKLAALLAIIFVFPAVQIAF